MSKHYEYFLVTLEIDNGFLETSMVVHKVISAKTLSDFSGHASHLQTIFIWPSAKN